MLANIDLLANEASTLDATLQQALGTLRDKRIRVIAAAQVLSDQEAPFGRLLLYDVADIERTITLLIAARIRLRK